MHHFTIAKETASLQQPDNTSPTMLQDSVALSEGLLVTNSLASEMSGVVYNYQKARIPFLDPAWQHIVDHHGVESFCRHMYVGDDVDRVCPHCGAKGHKHEAKTSKLRHLPCGKTPTFIFVHYHEMKCPCCKRKWAQYHYQMECSQLAVTQDLADFVVFQFLQSVVTDRSIACSDGIPEEVVTRILDKALTREYALRSMLPPSEDGKLPECSFKKPSTVITAVMVDEVARYGRHYVSLFRDPQTGDLLYYVEGHGKDAARAFCDWGGDLLDQKLQVGCDMNSAYAAGFKEKLPQSDIVNDFFHAQNHANDHVKTSLILVAKDLEKQGKTEAAKIVADESTLRLFTRGLDKPLSIEERKKMSAILKLHEDLPYIRKIIVKFQVAYRHGRNSDPVKMKKMMDEVAVLCNHFQEEDYTKGRKVRVSTQLDDYVTAVQGKVTESQDDLNYTTRPAQNLSKVSKGKARFRHPMVMLGHMIVTHMDGIVNYSSNQLTTGPLEGFNNLFKSMKHSKFGIKNFWRFILRLKARSNAMYQRSIRGFIIRPRRDSEYGQRLAKRALHAA